MEGWKNLMFQIKVWDPMVAGFRKKRMKKYLGEDPTFTDHPSKGNFLWESRRNIKGKAFSSCPYEGNHNWGDGWPRPTFSLPTIYTNQLSSLEVQSSTTFSSMRNWKMTNWLINYSHLIKTGVLPLLVKFLGFWGFGVYKIGSSMKLVSEMVHNTTLSCYHKR